jgi:hypothetical protein
MKKSVLVLVLLVSFRSFSQSSTPPTQPNISDSVTLKRNTLHKNNATILAGWDGVNIIQGSFSATNAKGSDKSFFKMNAYWNLGNLAIAAAELLIARKEMNQKLSLAQNSRKQHQLENILLLSTGLNVSCIFGGMYLNERGMHLNNEQTQGYGKSLILQGSFSLVFDIIQYFEHRANGKQLDKLMENINIGATPNGLGLTYNF